MKEFIEKLIGRLEEEREISYADFYEYLMKYELDNDFDEDDDWFYKGLIRAISIVNQLAEEYNNESVKTNADYIRNMTDEELAKILFGSCLEIMGKEQCNALHGNGCEQCVLNWLKAEREG